MSVDQTEAIDSIYIDPKTDDVLLVIADHLEWTDDDELSKEHMFLLQEKINSYLRFIESGEMHQRFPKTRGRESVIQVISKYPLSDEARRFCEKISSFLANAGQRIEFRRLPVEGD
jgi:hypothetical protein